MGSEIAPAGGPPVLGRLAHVHEHHAAPDVEQPLHGVRAQGGEVGAGARGRRRRDRRHERDGEARRRRAPDQSLPSFRSSVSTRLGRDAAQRGREHVAHLHSVEELPVLRAKAHGHRRHEAADLLVREHDDVDLGDHRPHPPRARSTRSTPAGTTWPRSSASSRRVSSSDRPQARYPRSRPTARARG
mgnify:CR=1 FL=1